MHAGDFADEPRRDGFAEPGQMRRPAAVLVDRELRPAPLGLLDELAAGSQILYEGLLRKDVLAGGERASHEIDAKLGVRRDVENLDPGIVQQPFEIIRRVRL